MLHFLKRQFFNPLLEFFNDSRAIGIILLVNTFISLLLANTGASNVYVSFWNIEFDQLHEVHLPHTILHWINDGLMALFFLQVGMEIKRELAGGELSSFRQAILPAAAALGGMVVPALIFLFFNISTAFQHGWGVPTATDIAFSLGIASLLGKRVPVALKVFLTALAIIDDLGAIVIIALFYGDDLQYWYLAGAVIICVLLFLANRKARRLSLLQVILGLLLWYCMFNSGIHATVAGVIFALLVPVRMISRYEHKLHNPVYFLVMPIFALANTAIPIPAGGLAILNGPLSWGIILGLCLGKPIGVFLSSFMMIKFKLADLPTNTNFYKLAGAGILAGIGFTMSIFIAMLAFNNPEDQDISKLAVLVASFISMIAGYLWLTFAKKTHEPSTA